jgi:hypothetical protein
MPLLQVVNDYISDITHRESGFRAIHTIQQGQVVRSSGTFVLVPKSHRTPDTTVCLTYATATLTFAQIAAVLGNIDQAGFTNHLDIKSHAGWRAFYQIIPRDLPTLNRDDSAGAPLHKDSAPCWKCRILMPLDCMHIDHSRPQAGGEIEAVAKVFRANGLTVGGPKGAKGVAYITALGAPVAAAATVHDRYTLNDAGTALFTLICRVGEHRHDVITTLNQLCMNHYINLRPMCLACNIARGAPLRYDPMT